MHSRTVSCHSRLPSHLFINEREEEVVHPLPVYRRREKEEEEEERCYFIISINLFFSHPTYSHHDLALSRVSREPTAK